jgi:hypothetical protein
MAYSTRIIAGVAVEESVAMFEWRNLHIHIVTCEPLTVAEVRTIERMLPKVASVGQFADVVGMVFGRSVRIRTQRPSMDIRLEVGR